MFKRFKVWKKARVRFLFQLGPLPDRAWYVRLTPNFGVGIPWFRGRRIRFSCYHGLQICLRATSGRWIVEKQILGRSKVKAERFATPEEIENAAVRNS